MPRTSRADTVLETEELLAAVDGNPELLPDIERHKAPVVEALAEVKVLNIQQQALKADGQAVTQKLKVATRRLKDVAMHLRAAVRADVGLRNEKLVQFKMSPLRPRSRKPKPAEPESGEGGRVGSDSAVRP